MGITTEEFISSFHSLNGTTIGERRKNLNLLLSYIKSDMGEVDFSLLHPETPLEGKFKLEALIYFKRVPELLEVLKSENPIFIQRILKISWFLQEAFQNISGEHLADSIFPYISFKAKVKLLNKLAFHLRNPLQGDAYFKAVEKKYGLYLATKLLPACSADLIMSCVKTNKTKILPRQLRYIIKMNPEIIEPILKELSSYVKVETEYKNVFIYLAHKIDTLLFLKLQNEYNLSINLGWRITDKVVQWQKQTLIQNPDKFYKFLHNKQIAKSLHQDFQNMYINLFPPSLNQFKRSVDEIVNILRQVPLKMRDVNLLLANFERLYGGQLWDHSDLISSELLDIMPAIERESHVKPENRPNNIPEEKWYSYMKTEKSIPYLKKAISLTSDIQARVKLIQFLVETCKVNEDRATLAGMCNYVVSRHRNDHISVRLGFLNKLMKSFKLSSLEEQHWTPINELIKIFTLNDEQFYHLDDYLEGYIYFRLQNNLPIEEQITQWVKGRYTNDLKILQEKPQFEKQCLLTLGEVIPKVFEAVSLEQYTLGFLNALMNWNKRHPEDQISLYGYPSMLNCLKRMLSEESNMFNAEIVLKYLFSTRNNLEQGDDLLKLYFARKDNLSTDYDIVKCLMHIEPSIIVLNINTTVRRLLNLYYKNILWPFWSYCKYYTHLEIPQKIVDVCLAVLKEKPNDNQDVIAKNAVAALSHLMTAHEFKRFSAPHYPSKLRKNTKSKKEEKTYKIQQYIGLCLRNLSPPSSAIEGILMFCKGNCLRLIQGSLYSVCDNINEDKLLPFLNELGDQAVLMRKNAMHLTFRVLDKQQIYGLLNKYMQAEKNASVRKLIFRKVFGYFLTNPDDYTWELVKINVNTVDVKDKEAFDVLMQTEKVPPHYFTQYIPFTWDVLNRLPGPESDIESNRGLILSSIKVDVIPSLSKEFCDGIIKKHLFKCEDEILTYFQSAVQTFAYRYIIYCQSKEEQEDRLNSIFSLLKNYISLTWQNSANRAEARNCVANFVKSLCLDFLTDSRLNAEILETFAGLWNSTLKPHDAFDDYLHLQFTLIYVERLTIPQIGQKLALLCESLTNIYGGFVLEAFCNKINAFIQYFLHNTAGDLEENRYELIESLVKPDQHSTTCLTLVLLLLKGHEPATLRTEEKYKAIIEVLEKSSDPVVRLHLHSHFRETSYGS